MRVATKARRLLRANRDTPLRSVLQGEVGVQRLRRNIHKLRGAERLDGWAAPMMSKQLIARSFMRPPFETAASRPLQDKGYVGPPTKVNAYEWRAPSG